jgi:xanthine dehydrogenase small subunit
LIHFLLNEKEISTNLPPGMVLLDFIRYHQHLMGTKIGCREGDCGACTVLVGEIKDNKLQYFSATCCLMPLGNAHGKHIVTIEGINFFSGKPGIQDLNPIQQALADEGATQCGFCTPGFVISLAGFCLNSSEPDLKNAIASIDGNICRCTGYKSIQRAAVRIVSMMKERKNEEPANFAAKENILPAYFSTIKERLKSLLYKTNGIFQEQEVAQFVGGGTDLYVQKHDEMKEAGNFFLFNEPPLKGIVKENNKCIIGASCTVTDLYESEIIRKNFPDFDRYTRLISSTPIRNMATIGGNFINASPIGDFTIFFLALDTYLLLRSTNSFRELPLRKLYKGYKILDKKPEEYIEKIWFELPAKNTFFNFEKVSKRTNLDIASVNTAIKITMTKNTIVSGSISAGGVGPIPLYLAKTSAFLQEKQLTEELVKEIVNLAQTEISPISDARGHAEYKRLLLKQLIKAHFISIFPELEVEKLLR